MEDSTLAARHGNPLGSLLKYLGRAVALFALCATPAFAHDPTEITTRVYLRTNSLEVRITVAAQTVMLLLEADGHSVSGLSTAADLDAARPALSVCGGKLFQILASGKSLVAVETNVDRSVEDHIEIKLIYPRPGPGSLRFNAVQLSKLPAGEPYGAVVTVVDLANNVFLNQKLLTASDPVLEINVSAPPAPTVPPRPHS